MNEELKKEAREELELKTGINWSKSPGISIDKQKEQIERSVEFINRYIDLATKQEKNRIRGLVPEEREIGEETHCKTCGGHIAAGECDCNGFNQCRELILKAIDNE